MYRITDHTNGTVSDLAGQREDEEYIRSLIAAGVAYSVETI
ncbi:hypothetical protein AB0I84_45445 [Streptomyces spectabilis]